MKKIFVLSLLFILLGCTSNDRIIELEKRIDTLETRIAELEKSIADTKKVSPKTTKLNTKKKSTTIKKESGIDVAPLPLTTVQNNSKLSERNNKNEENVNTTSGRCQAMTKAGTQCSRNAKEGSNYCWQHQNSENTSTTQKSSSYSGDRTIYTGPRGGQYYYNSKGNKVYIKRKK